MLFYKRIKELQKKLNLTQKEFAKKIGMTEQGIIRWKQENPNIKESSLRLIESTFSVNPTWLRDGEGSMFDQYNQPNIDDTIIAPVILWLKSLDNEKKAWAKIELSRQFPEFKEWLSQYNKSEVENEQNRKNHN